MPDITTSPKILGDILLENKLITEEQLNVAMQEQEKTGERLGTILVKRGFVSQQVIGKILEQQVGISYVNLGTSPIDTNAVRLVPENLVRRLKALPVRVENNTLFVAMLYPINLTTIDELRFITGLRIRPLITTDRELQDAINRHFDVKNVAKAAIEEFRTERAIEIQEVTGVPAEEAVEQVPVIRLVNSIIIGGITADVSDIHLEPQLQNMRVRYRVDGVLHDAMTIPPYIQKAAISRMKVMAALNIAEHRLPQDGQFSFRFEEKDYDMRVSTLPTRFGEKIVMRILDKERVIIGLSLLGMLSDELSLFEDMIDFSYGMIIVAGPTGSGKTTTLYAVLNQLNSPAKNIVTIEDPIEFMLPGINQIQVNPKGGITFGTGLRAILRQDPNIVMVGEIRDDETAKISVHASLTGQLVLTTIHTPDAPSSIIRLMEMDIEPYLLSSTLIGVIAQRLVRIICPGCKEKYEPTDAELQYFPKGQRVTSLFEGKGCKQCNFTGYKGRTGIFEVMRINTKLRDLIGKKAPTGEIKQEAIKIGMKSLFESGLYKVLQGITTLSEILRVAPREE